MNDELLKNRSGYTDITAYWAIKKMEGENDMDIKSGEIWEAEAQNGTREVLVIKNNIKYCTVLMLNSTPGMNIIGNDDIDYGRPFYVFADKFIRRIRALTKEDFWKVKKEMRKALDLEIPKEDTGEVRKEEKDLMCDLEIEKAEKRVYKSLYEGLLKKIMEK